MAQSTVYAIRIVWRDIGLDTHHGRHPGPIRYRVEVEGANGCWETVLDRSQSEYDLMTDYRECVPTRARLLVLHWPQDLLPAVAELTIFGNTQ